jgi:hypothetical protein
LTTGSSRGTDRGWTTACCCRLTTR